MITIQGQIAAASGLRGEDRMLVHRLVDAWYRHRNRNVLRHVYYTMNNTLKDLGISVPPQLKRLNAACGWGKKCVDVMVEHSKFEGYTADDFDAQEELERIERRNRMTTLYRLAATSALEQCFSLFFVSRDEQGHARVSAYPASVCGCTWDDAHQRLEAAMFVVSMRKSELTNDQTPDWVNVVTDEYLIRLRMDQSDRWHAEYEQHGLGHVPVFVAAYEPTLERPFGTSRITREVMGYIDSAVRANVNEEIAAAFAVSTQKYLLGTAGDPFEKVSRWEAFVGSIFNIDYNSDDEVMPQFGQLPQPSMQPIADHWRLLCGRMSAATGIHVSQFGQVHDNPASSDAIYAENEPLILKCKDWNEDVKRVLVDVATAMLATERNTAFDAIDEQGLGIVANMPNPAMPTLAQQTDASVKIASVVPGFAQTMAFWTMNGFSIEEADRILRQIEDAKTKEASNALIANIFGRSQTQEPTEQGEVTDDGGAA
jgi:hypothetical protein